MIPGIVANERAKDDAAWAVALRLPQFGYAEIAAECGLTMERATDVVRAWVNAGQAKVVRERRGGQRKLFALVEGAVRPDPSRGRTPEHNMWTAMRGLSSFTPTELSLHATTEAIEVTGDAAQAYCRALLASGHLSVARKAVPGKREAIYRLVRNTGPKPPREKRVRAVIDDNEGTTLVIGGGAT